MRQILCLLFDVELFNIEELEKAHSTATALDGEIYSWKTSEDANWLDKGVSNVDVLGLVILPKKMPIRIELPNDAEEG